MGWAKICPRFFVIFIFPRAFYLHRNKKVRTAVEKSRIRDWTLVPRKLTGGDLLILLFLITPDLWLGLGAP